MGQSNTFHLVGDAASIGYSCYTLNNSGPVNAVLTDLSRIAKNWNLNNQVAGSHTLNSDLDLLPVGIYFFSLEQGGQTQPLKIVVQ